ILSNVSVFPVVAVTSAGVESSRQYASTSLPTLYSTANLATMLPPEAVHTGLVPNFAVTEPVPARVSVTAIPPVVYPFAFACSLVTPAYVVEDVVMLDVDRNKATLYELPEMIVPLRISVRAPLTNVHAPAANVVSSYI